MRPNITITIPTPYLPIDEYCRLTLLNYLMNQKR